MTKMKMVLAAIPRGRVRTASAAKKRSCERATKIMETRILEGRLAMRPPILEPSFSASMVEPAIQIPAVTNDAAVFSQKRESKINSFQRRIKYHCETGLGSPKT